MPVEGAVQGLVAAFTFGIVVNAASAALFLYTKGHGSSLFRDSQRLVLVLFLLSAALWAQIDFITVILDITKSSMPCQVGIIFATVFDQLGRFWIEQYLVWAMNDGSKPTVMHMVPQFLVLGRFVAGAVFAGFTRPQTDTFCVATSSAFPVAVVVIVLDVVILLALTARAFSSLPDTGVLNKDSELARRLSLKLILLGVAIWTASSVTLLLGIKTVELVARTAVPATGLTILIIIVTGCAGSLGSNRGSMSRAPEAPSPRRINISRDISTSDSEYPPSRYEDLKEAAIRSSTTFINPREVPSLRDDRSAVLPFMAGPGVIPEEPVAPSPVNMAGSDRTQKVERTASVRGGLFGFGSRPAPSITVAKVMISNPILQDNDAQNPLNKIATMDLQDAARAEKERRAKMQADPPVPKRPVTQMSMSPEEVLKRGVSLRRKDVASVASQQSVYPIGLQPASMGTTTAAQLSPGVEEIRRRSPRQPAADQMPPIPQPVTPLEEFEVEEVSQPIQVQPAEMKQTRAQTPPSLDSLAQPSAPKPVARPEIRPSRQAPPSPKAPSPEPVMKAIQKRPTIGLPTNPKARALRIAQEASAQQQQQQTVLFVNNFVYNDPTAVQNIINGANDRVAKKNAQASETDASVVNRPRPVPRRADSMVSPSPSPKHKRNKSGGSISRKSILTSAPGSPTQLPPLPPPPVPGVGIRPQPNDTKSMTVDEKMTLFFPSPPSGNAAKRNSPVPQMPPIPVSYLDMSSPTDSRRSNRTTKTSFKTESILDVDEIPRKKPDPTSRFSPLTELNLGDEGTSWLPGLSTDGRSVGMARRQASGHTAKRASSPVIPPVMPSRSSGWTDNSDARTEDDVTTNWGTVHSPELAVGVQVLPVVPKGVQNSTARTTDRQAPSSNMKPVLPPVNQDNITFMLDELDFERQESWLLGPGEPKPEPKRSTPSPSQWHRRVGDECPTFSAREKTRSRKAPAPTPLMLNGRPSKNTVVIQAEPSPLESPEHALQEIQAQLKKLEDSTRDSMNSPSRRLALLENLEREMGQQEDHWQEMKHDLARDSMTSVQTTSPNRNSRMEPAVPVVQISREPASRSSIALERRASRRAKMRNNGGAKGNEMPTLSPETQRTTSVWQKRLTEAQTEYMEVAAELLKSRNTNFMSLSKAQLGSPTPPDSDESDQEMGSLSNRLNAMVQPLRGSRVSACLWRPAPRVVPIPANRMWAPVVKSVSQPEPELPGLLVRPVPRKEWAPLQIHSAQLWRKPYTDDGQSLNGLWRPAWASAAPPANLNRSSVQDNGQSQSQKAPRPLTQRPPRRNKRMTLLPDILESPEPLPDKRGTLGIFQFPWGERSDTASIMSSRPSMFMAMPGTMASSGPSLTAAQEQRSKQLESTEYSSSFFDDYDDDDEENSEDGEGDESDDAFDETTLWEIASLLKTDNVPSKNSLFPPPRASTSVVEEYMDDIPSDDESRSSRGQSIVIGLGEPRDILFEQPREVGVKAAEPQQPAKPKGKSQAIVTDDTSFWTIEEELQAKDSPPMPAPAVRPVFGLPSNPKASKIPRVAPSAPQPAAIPAPVAPKHSLVPRLTDELKKTRKGSGGTSVGLWQPAPTEKGSITGLFALNTNRKDYRTTTAEPAAKNMTRKPRPSEHKPLEKLSSTSLWTIYSNKKATVKPWISHIPKSNAADWEAALKDAMAASYRRRAATPAEWSAALTEAVHLSRRFDASKCHPVFAASSLVTKSEWFHPAATGYTYDVANVHPVFFGSLALTCPRDAVHPAYAAYASKKLRRQRSKVSTRERPASRGRAMSRSDSVGGSSSSSSKRKEEIRAQIRALEQEVEMPQPVGQDMIMAQIEALEQERLFAQQFAQEELRRRTSMGYGIYTEQPMTEEPEPVLLSAAEIVAQQQRRISLAQMRGPMDLGAGQPVQLAKAEPVKLVTAKPVQLVQDTPASVLTKGLWTAPQKRPAGNNLKGLWTAESAPHGSLEPVGEEDGEAHARRARGRKAIQKMARRGEILAQIAAIEADIDPMAEFKAQQLWRVTRVRRSRRRDWLHERKPSRVALRY
ncbi:hypothetical protein QBC47DRAFT_193301 [Echria macrotheca]|uniref:Uncharacterized protein n=1 Tax=Echria macrotheca TaxID=438768 RepID=A0AAJ0FBS3_9PEZI|nr:hypothetical protein QBC47DRAFT_193301 [Echria macrotheca]